MASDIKDTNIEVCVRIRPLLVETTTTAPFFASTKPNVPRGRRFVSRLPPPGEAVTRKPEVDPHTAWDVVGEATVQQSAHHTEHIQGRTECYTLDRIYGPDSASKDVYINSVKPVVISAMEGYHASVFAYGQTSTGKTHTMTGSKAAPGILPLAVQDCFRFVASGKDEIREYLLRISYLEIYNEQIIDLLSETPHAVRIFESPKEGVVVRGLREEVVTSPQDVYDWVAQGELRRQVGSTNMNKHSSRSHAIFRLWIESKSPEGGVRVSSLSLVDLAGSESVRLTGNTGDRQKEGQYINKSLTTLGQVVFKLSELKRRHDDNTMKSHIPYRDSKLTRLLQPSLSGNAQIVLISCISPQVSHLQESHNTLKFAIRAKRIQQHATVSEVSDEKTMLQTYRDEIQNLKQQLEEARTNQVAKVQVETSDDDIQDLVEAIQQMERLILKTRTINQRRIDDEDLLLSPDPEDFLKSVLLEGEQQQVPNLSDAEVLKEMHRIQGLLSNVLQQKSKGAASPRGTIRQKYHSPTRDAEVEQLRAQLYEHEVTTSLRKADSSFLQRQLEEKDSLLQEVSKILEAVEQRQMELEKTNNALKASLDEAHTKISHLSKRLQLAEAGRDALIATTLIGTR